MDKRVDVLLRDGTRRRATATIAEDSGMVLAIGGIVLMPSDYAMQGARIIASDPATLRAIAKAGFQAVQAGNVTVATRMPREVSEDMQRTCKERGVTMSAALTVAARAWLAAGSPLPCDSSTPHKGSGQRG